MGQRIHVELKIGSGCLANNITTTKSSILDVWKDFSDLDINSVFQLCCIDKAHVMSINLTKLRFLDISWSSNVYACVFFFLRLSLGVIYFTENKLCTKRKF